MNIEIERKFLLKSKPDINPDELITIDQWYWKNSQGSWERVRECNSTTKGRYFVHTIKKTISKGVNMEDEKILTEEEYNYYLSICKLKHSQSRNLKKERLVYKMDKLKWEVDVFKNELKLIIAEIEIPKKTFKLQIPNYIKNQILLEVTGLKQFSNKNLSKPVHPVSI